MRAPPRFRPENEDEVAAFLRERSLRGASVHVRGGGSKAEFGLPDFGLSEVDMIIDMEGLSGITLYEPKELVLTAKAGTPVREIEAAVTARGQMLAFEPPQFGSLFGNRRESSLGGTVASGWSGPRRIKAGAVRDHVLGARAVGGDGGAFKSGGRVVKNVTGFDLPKLLTGSRGTLAVLTEITIKVLPAPEAARTLVLSGLEDGAAIAILSEALASPHDVSGAAHLPAAVAARSRLPALARAAASATLIRLEGFGPSVGERLDALVARFGGQGPSFVLDDADGAIVWAEIRDLGSLVAPDAILWRLSLAASEAAAAVAAIARALPCEALYDWGGSLVWLAIPADGDPHAERIRSLIPSGHAVLFRAPAPLRATTPIFTPQIAALASLTQRVKSAFDPAGILGV